MRTARVPPAERRAPAQRRRAERRAPRSSTAARGGAGKAAGAVATGLNHVVLPAGGQGAPAHCHSQEEELFVVLEGEGVLELWPRGASSAEEHPLRAGDVISRPAGTGVAHALRAGAQGHDLPRLRHPRVGRHVLLPAVRAGLAARPGHRPALPRDRLPARYLMGVWGGA